MNMKRHAKIKWAFVPAIFILTASVIIFCSMKSVAIENLTKQKISVQAVHHTIWGSSCAPFPGENLDRVQSWKRLNEKLKELNGGYGLEGHRSYDRGLPASWSVTAMAQDTALCRVSFGEISPDWAETANGSNFEAIKKFVQSIPKNRIVYLIFQHEPEKSAVQKGHSTVLLQEAFAKFADAVLAADRPNVHPCFNLMSYTFKTQSGRNPDDFNLGIKLKPGQINKVIASLDGYAHESSTSAQEIFEANFAKMASWGFTRFGIFETGVHFDGTTNTRAKWITGLGRWVNSRKDIELVSWFNSGVGTNAGSIGWYLGNWSKNGNVFTWTDDDGSVAAYAQLLKNK